MICLLFRYQLVVKEIGWLGIFLGRRVLVFLSLRENRNAAYLLGPLLFWLPVFHYPARRGNLDGSWDVNLVGEFFYFYSGKFFKHLNDMRPITFGQLL